MTGKAVVRSDVEKIAGVTRTWLELEPDADFSLSKVLVVEVSFNTDPNNVGWEEETINQIIRVARDTLNHKTGMSVQKVRIVPQLDS